jgi:hypothetical protein
MSEHTEIEQSTVIDDQEIHDDTSSLKPPAPTSVKRGVQQDGRVKRSDKQKEQTERLTRIRFLRQQEVANRLQMINDKLMKLEERMTTGGPATPKSGTKPKKVVQSETIPMSKGRGVVRVEEQEADFPVETETKQGKGKKSKEEEVIAILKRLASGKKGKGKKVVAEESSDDEESEEDESEEEEEEESEYEDEEEDEEEEVVVRPKKKGKKMPAPKKTVKPKGMTVSAATAAPAKHVYGTRSQTSVSSYPTSRPPASQPACFWSWS